MQFQPVYPFEAFHGAVSKRRNSRGEIVVTRQKTRPNGTLGPKECYPLRPHKGAWSKPCQTNRAIYSAALQRLYAEARNPEKAEEWQAKFARYTENPYADEWASIAPNLPTPSGKMTSLFSRKPAKDAVPKIYPTIRGFMLAVIRAELAAKQ